MMRFLPILAAVSLLAAPVSLDARGQGFDLRMTQAENMDGHTVPAVDISVARDSRSINRGTIESAIRARLAQAGVRPDLIQLQSVATAAIDLARTQDEGEQVNCYEEWCAMIALSAR